VVTLKRPKERITNCVQLQQPRRNTLRKNAHTINVQTVTDGISWRVTSGENTSLILVDDGVWIIEGCYRNVMLL